MQMFNQEKYEWSECEKHIFFNMDTVSQSCHKVCYDILSTEWNKSARKIK